MPESDVSDTDALDAATTAFLEGLLSSLPTPGDLAEVCQPEIPMDQLQYMVRVGRCSGDTRHPSPRHAAPSYHQARDLMMNPRSRFRHAAPRIMAEISTTKQYQVGDTRCAAESPSRLTCAVSRRRVRRNSWPLRPRARQRQIAVSGRRGFASIGTPCMRCCAVCMRRCAPPLRKHSSHPPPPRSGRGSRSSSRHSAQRARQQPLRAQKRHHQRPQAQAPARVLELELDLEPGPELGLELEPPVAPPQRTSRLSEWH